MSLIHTRDLADSSEAFKCYSLTYGAWGFVSQVFTFWQYFCGIYGINPLPCGLMRRGGKQSTWSILFAIGNIVVPLTLSILNITHRNSLTQKEVRLLAIWKLLLNMYTGITGFYFAWQLKHDFDLRIPFHSWLLLGSSISSRCTGLYNNSFCAQLFLVQLLATMD